jgi:integrase
MAIGKVTKDKVDALVKGKADLFLWDDKLSGFGVKVTPAGAKVYLYQYRIGGRGAQTRRYTIGKHGALTPDQARTRAKALAHMVEHGTDPREAEDAEKAAKVEAQRLADERNRLEGELAFSRIAPKFLDWYENDRERRPSSVALARLVIDRYLTPALADRPLPHITRSDLQPILDAIPSHKRGMRRAVFAYASTLFSWAMKERGIIEVNPLRAMAKPDAPKARERVLADVDLADLWRATDTLAQPFGSFFRLLVLTAQRRSEVAGMVWAELDRETKTWVIPAARAKNKAAHLVPLTDAVIAELDRLALAVQLKARINDLDGTQWPKLGHVLTTTGRTPISGITKAKDALDKAIGEARGTEEEPAPLEAWRIHDLRRTVATGFQRLGVRFEVTEAVLNHVSGSKAGVAGIYQKHHWQDEKRSALDAWAKHVAAITAGEGKADNVVPLRAGSAA